MTVQLTTKKQLHLQGTYKAVIKQVKRFSRHGYRCVGFVGLRKNGESTATAVLEKTEVGR